MNRIAFSVVMAAIASVGQPMTHAQELVFAELDGVQLVSIPQPSPGDGFVATKLQARAVHADAILAAFANLSMRTTHQVWTGNGLQAAGGTAKGPPEVDEMYAAEWVPFDAHRRSIRCSRRPSQLAGRIRAVGDDCSATFFYPWLPCCGAFASRPVE